jgi:hypothetical protein
VNIENPVGVHPVQMRRYNGKCKWCKAKYSTLAGCYSRGFPIPGGKVHNTLANHGSLLVSDTGEVYVSLYESGLPIRCTCGKPVMLNRVNGKVRADKACDGRCMAATGQDCECACGGKNHGCAHNMPSQGG